MTIDIEAVVRWIDPDPFEHFQSIEQAAEYYQTYAPEDWRKAVEELGEDDDQWRDDANDRYADARDWAEEWAERREADWGRM